MLDISISLPQSEHLTVGKKLIGRIVSAMTATGKLWFPASWQDEQKSTFRRRTEFRSQGKVI
jgi:hypothetical protein